MEQEMKITSTYLPSSRAAKIYGTGSYFQTLDPNRTRPLEFKELVYLGLNKLSQQGCSKGIQVSFVNSLTEIIESAIHNYPDNIFWDLSGFISSMTETFKNKKGENFTNKVLELLSGYGIHTPIKFQYLHAFTYGFDWARWVASDPYLNKKHAPFSFEFLEYMLKRKSQILDLISKNDSIYPQLNKPSTHRNRYQFDRSPNAEIKMLTYLSRNNLIPLKTWKTTIHGRWNIDPIKLRTNIWKYDKSISNKNY